MGVVNLNNIKLGNNFEEDDPDTTIYVRSCLSISHLKT